MKAVILAGGLGTRIQRRQTSLRPKPMIEIGGKPVLWHILKIYSHHGINDFIICLGYKGYMIKEYFANYFLHTSDVTFDLAHNEIQVHHRHAEPWRVTLVDTGDDTQTGGRLKRVGEFLGDETFCFTYGDGVSDIDIRAELAFHREQWHDWRRSAPCNLPAGSARSISKADGSLALTEKPAGRRLAGSMVDSSCSNPKRAALHRRRRQRLGTRADGSTRTKR